MSRAGLLAVVAVSSAALLTTVGLSSARPTSSAGPSLDWAMARSSLEHVSSANPSEAKRQFDSPSTLVQNSPPLRQRPTPAGWNSSNTERWASFAAFAADVRTAAVPSYVTVVHYDNEAWSQTPLGEQRRPGYYERRFCSVAHSNGWRCYTGPGQDLCGVLDHSRDETYAQCYLSLDLAGEAARYADVIDIQAQTLEGRGARTYGNFIRRAAAQARATNPKVVVLGNIAPSPDGRAVSAQRMTACARAALPYVSGFYTTVGNGEGATMVEFLKLLEAQG